MKTLLTFDQYAAAVLCAAMLAPGCGGQVTDTAEDLPTEIPTERVTQGPDGGTTLRADAGEIQDSGCVEHDHILCQHPKERR